MFSIDGLTTIWLIVALSLFPVTVAYIVFFKKTVKILKQKHRETYKKLGEVGFVKNNSISSSGKFISFLILGKYRELDNLKLQKIGDILRALLVLGLVLFAGAFIMPILIGKYN